MTSRPPRLQPSRLREPETRRSSAHSSQRIGAALDAPGVSGRDLVRFGGWDRRAAAAEATGTMLSSAGDRGEQIGRAARGLQRVVRCHGAVRPRPWRRPHVRIRVTKPAVPRDRRWAATTCSWCGGSMDPKPEDGFRRGARNPPGTSPGTSPSRDLQSICSPGDPAAGGGPRVAAADPAGVGRPAARARPPGSTTAASTAKATTVSPGRSTPCWRSAACPHGPRGSKR